MPVNAGANTLQGKAGDDRLSGAGGADVLRGGVGEDTLTGGGGADRFAFAAVTESRTADGRDTILDLVRGQDRIDLSLIDAKTVVAGDQAFTFIGAALFSGLAGQLRYGGGDTVMGDVNGDGLADFHIFVVGVAALASTDFVL